MGRGKGGGFGTTLALALVIVVLSAALGVGLSRHGGQLPLVGSFFGDGETRTTTSPVVVEGIQKLDRLASVRVTESVIVTKEEPGRLGELLTGEKLLLVATGEVEAGVDLADLGRDDVEVVGKTARIRLPEPEILSSSLDEEETRVYDRDRGPLDLGVNEDLAEEARADAETEIVAAARENGILEQAETNAEEGIRAFVLSLGFEKVEFAG